MTNTLPNPDPANGSQRNLIGWLLLPIALFPLVALSTYDWRSIEALHTPVSPSSNLIGPLGDRFAYFCYQLVGLSAWIIPILCVIAAVRAAIGHRTRSLRRAAWCVLITVSSACLLQLAQKHSPGIAQRLDAINLANAGGAIGYLLAHRLLSPLVSDFGSGVIFSLVLLVSAIGAIGLGNLASWFGKLYRWAIALGEARHLATANDLDGAKPQLSKQDEYLAMLKAKADAKHERELERQRMRAERDAALEATHRRKEAVLAARAAAAQERELELAEAAKPAEKTLFDVEAAKPAEKSLFDATPPKPQAVPVRNEVSDAPAKPATLPAGDDADRRQDDKGPYILPGINLLAPLKHSSADHSDVGVTSQRLIDTLKIFGVDATLTDTVQGPVVTKYAILLAPGTRYTTVTNLQSNLKGALHAKSLRIEAPIPGREEIGIEVPNLKPAGITFREIFESEAWKNSTAELPLLFGKRADGKELVADLASMPHMLVAGATGQGKSVCLNSLINGLLMTRTPEQLKLIMVDPKCVEFTPYSSIPHLLVPVITDNRKVVFSLHWAVAEMEKRLKLFARAKVRNIYDFNHRKIVSQPTMFGDAEKFSEDMPRTVPYIVIIIDEAADLIGQCGKDVNPDIQRITQKARAAGIHLILATQRPDAKIITGAIKANIPGRVAFKTASSVDSRTILDDTGAENLIGKGDMLFKGKDGQLIRAQGAWISDEEIANVTSFIEQHSSLQFDETFATKLGRVKEAAIDDPFAANEDDPDNQPKPEENAAAARAKVKASENADLFKRAIEVIINTNRASVSHFQRQLAIGYNHSARLCDELEAKGVIGPQAGAGPRTIIMDQQQLLTIFNGNDATNAGVQDEAGESPEPSEQPDETAEDETTQNTENPQ